MLRNMLGLIALLGFITTACDNKNSGRPAPNSAPQPEAARPQTQSQRPPAAPQDSGTTQRPPTKDPAAPANPNAPANPSDKDGLKGPPSQGPQSPINNSRVLYFDNSGEVSGTAIKDKTFLVSNFDPVNFGEDRRSTNVQIAGTSQRYSSKDLTHLSDESYANCADPRCLKRIASEAEYMHHARTCWMPSLTAEVARLEFNFDQNGSLSFVAVVDRTRYGAKNIAYRFDGRRYLHIEPFLAMAILEGGESRALAVGGSTLTEEDDGSIKSVASTVYGKKGFGVRTIIALDLGTLKNGQFQSLNIGHRYVGSTITALVPVATPTFRTTETESVSQETSQQPEAEAKRPARRTRDTHRNNTNNK